jgi:hypothetical protein
MIHVYLLEPKQPEKDYFLKELLVLRAQWGAKDRKREVTDFGTQFGKGSHNISHIRAPKKTKPGLRKRP